MKKTIIQLILLLLISSCKSSRIHENNGKIETTGKIIKKGVIECFKKGLLDANKDSVYCEASGVIYYGRKLIIANDKPMPGNDKSSVFEFKMPKQFPSYIDHNSMNYYKNDPFRNAMKIEAFTKLPDNDLLLATTAFNRIKSNSNDWDGYNSLLYWDGNEGWVKYALKSNNNGIESSKGLRHYFKHALKSKTLS